MVERVVRETALATAAALLAARLNADLCDGEPSQRTCACGATAHRAGRRSKTFTTALGPLTLERAWYHCAACASGFSPRDQALGLQDQSLSPGVMRMVGLCAAQLSFDNSSSLLRELAGLAVQPKQVERHAEALGREVARDEREVVEAEPASAATLIWVSTARRCRCAGPRPQGAPASSPMARPAPGK